METRNKIDSKLSYYESQEENISSSYFSKKFKHIINNINIFVIKSLKKTKNPIKRANIEVNENFINILKDKYNINNKYKNCEDFLFDFKIETNRLIETSLRSSSLYSIDRKNFSLKINNKKTIKYQTKNALTKEKKLNPSISIKFLRIVDNNINDKQITQALNEKYLSFPNFTE